MKNKFTNTVGAVVLSFEELDDEMRKAFSNLGVNIDDIEIATDPDTDEIAFFFYGGESHTNFDNNFKNILKPEIAFNDKAEDNDEENYYIAQATYKKTPSVLSILFERSISECFLREDDGKACIVFAN